MSLKLRIATIGDISNDDIENLWKQIKNAGLPYSIFEKVKIPKLKLHKFFKNREEIKDFIPASELPKFYGKGEVAEKYVPKVDIEAFGVLEPRVREKYGREFSLDKFFEKFGKPEINAICKFISKNSSKNIHCIVLMRVYYWIGAVKFTYGTAGEEPYDYIENRGAHVIFNHPYNDEVATSVIHELGHTFGLHHGIPPRYGKVRWGYVGEHSNKNCIMYSGVDTAKRTDAKFCSICKKILETFEY